VTGIGLAQNSNSADLRGTATDPSGAILPGVTVTVVNNDTGVSRVFVTAGSSLLYSQEFYTVAKTRLQPGGILQQWLPEADDATQAAVARSIKNSFPYIRVFQGMDGWGWHFLASDRPIPVRTAAELVARMPQSAVQDMMEWGPARS